LDSQEGPPGFYHHFFMREKAARGKMVLCRAHLGLLSSA
jgi:hypothetical protein